MFNNGKINVIKLDRIKNILLVIIISFFNGGGL